LASFGHIFRAFGPHILLLAAGGLKTDIFKTVVKVFRDQGFQVLWTELLFILCTEVQCWLGEVRLVQHMVFICCVFSRSVA
jgi:hypothetical protein